MTNVVATDEFVEWLRSLSEADAMATARVVDHLEQEGVDLGFPFSSAIKGSRYALRELRIQSRGRALRVLYVFDPRRDAVLLLGGDKTGDERFYQRMVPVAEQVWETYLAEQVAGLHDEKG